MLIKRKICVVFVIYSLLLHLINKHQTYTTMKTSKPFTLSYALVPSAMLLASIGLLNFDSDETLSYGCLVVSGILLVVTLIITIRQKMKSPNKRFT